MKNVLLAAVIAAVFPVSAHAADLAYKSAPMAQTAYDWTGFYLGAGVGFRSANVSEQTQSAVFVGVDLMNPFSCSVVLCGTTQSLDHTAFRFNPYFGYNWQIGPQWLVGLEGDVGFGSKTSTINGVPLPGAGGLSFANFQGDSFAVKTGWDASARARVGYLVTPGLLVYATGGAAWQHVEATSTCGINNDVCGIGNGFAAPITITHTRTMPGYTVGGGIETMFWGHWLVRGEFRYADFGTITNTDVRTGTSPQVLTTSYKLHLSTETALIGVGYKF